MDNRVVCTHRRHLQAAHPHYGGGHHVPAGRGSFTAPCLPGGPRARLGHKAWGPWDGTSLRLAPWGYLQLPQVPPGREEEPTAPLGRRRRALPGTGQHQASSSPLQRQLREMWGCAPLPCPSQARLVPSGRMRGPGGKGQSRLGLPPSLAPGVSGEWGWSAARALPRGKKNGKRSRQPRARWLPRERMGTTGLPAPRNAPDRTQSHVPPCT